MTAPAERIPQSVAIRVTFKAYLASDHATPATGKTIAITISKNGAAFGNPSAGATNATRERFRTERCLPMKAKASRAGNG